MNTNRLSKTIEDILNRQVTNEANNAQIYLTYAIWADSKGYSGIANLFFRHSGEERNHMMKFIQYIQNRGGKAKIFALDAGPKDPKDLHECFNEVFKSEVDNTGKIYEIVELAQKEKDWATWNFAQWFVTEQIEEETLVMDLMDKLEIAGGPKATDESLFYLDREIGKQEDEAELARSSSVDDPA